MGASELQEWMTYWRMEPWGSYRDNIHAGLIASTIANVYRSKNRRPVSFEEFMLSDRDLYKKKKTKETLAWMKSVATRK